MSTSFAHRFDAEEYRDVFVVDPERVALTTVQSKAEDLFPGENVRVIPLVEDKVNLRRIEDQAREIRRVLLDFDPDKDRIVVVGRSMANFLSGYLLGLMGHRVLKLLLYDFDDDAYFEFTLGVAR